MYSLSSICIRKIIDDWIDFKHGRPDQQRIKTLSALGICSSESEYAKTLINFSKKPLCEAGVRSIDNLHIWSQLVYCVAKSAALTDAHSVNQDPLLVSSLGPEICYLTLNELRTAMRGQISALLEAVLGKLVNTIFY